MRFRILFSVILTAVSLAVGSTVQAAPPQPQPQSAPVISAEVRQQMQKTRAAAAFYNQTTREFDAAGALAAGVDQKSVTDFEAGITWGNAYRTGTVALSPEQAQAAAACAGRTAFYRKLTYIEIWMNDCDVKVMAGLLSSSGNVATIAGAIIALTGIGVPAGAAIAIAMAM